MSVTSTRRPLKILQVGSGFPGWGGTELHLVNLSEQLIRRGHSVTVSCRPGGFVEQEAKKRGLPTVAVTVKRQHDWHDAKTYSRLMGDEKYDVVHVHWSTDYLVAPTVAWRRGVPVVLMSRHSPYQLQSAIGRFLYDRVLFDRIIALSESVRRTLLGQGLRAERVVTIHHGTDTDAFRQTTLPPEEVRKGWGIPEGRFVVGLVGRIAPEKGIMTFLEALAQAQNAHGVVIGEGPQLEEAKAKAAELGLADRLTWAGFRSDVNNAINALDALVLASTWAEPCAAVIQQAMALSKPVIGTDIGGTPEMVADKETGLLVPPEDADAMAWSISQIATDPAMRARMGAAGRERAEAHFTLSGMVDTIENLYYALHGGKTARRHPAENTGSSNDAAALKTSR